MEFSGQLHIPADLPGVPIREEAEWASQPVWTVYYIEYDL